MLHRPFKLHGITVMECLCTLIAYLHLYWRVWWEMVTISNTISKYLRNTFFSQLNNWLYSIFFSSICYSPSIKRALGREGWVFTKCLWASMSRAIMQWSHLEECSRTLHTACTRPALAQHYTNIWEAGPILGSQTLRTITQLLAVMAK